jgi:transposase InsO family protein
MADLTEVPGLLGLFRFKVAAVMDVFSRMPLAAQVFYTNPSSGAITELFKKTVQRFGIPNHFVSDQGTPFTALRFRNVLKSMGVQQRFGAVGKTGSIALIERLWRTLKNTSNLRFFKPLLKRDLERRLELALIYYAYFRPHQGLGGATPAEVYFGIPPAHLSATHPPRARPREGPTNTPFAIAYLDPEKQFPFLMHQAA